MFSLEDKVSIITGASSGIGRAVAVLFSQLGSKLVLVGRNELNLDQTISMCNAKSENDILKIVGDLKDTQFSERIVNETIKKFNKINILVNNAGIAKHGSLERINLQDYDEIMNLNVRSIIYLTKCCLPHLKAEKSSIINISSLAGTHSFPGVLAYCMSKSALDQFTKCIALELAPKQIRVNSVNPGTINTNIAISGGLTQEEYQKHLERAKSLHPLGRYGTPEEVAQAVAFLASDLSSFITGNLIYVDGGRSLVSPH